MAESQNMQRSMSAAMYGPDGNVYTVSNADIPKAVQSGGEMAVPMLSPKGDRTWVRASQVRQAQQNGGKVDWTIAPQEHQEGFWSALGGDLWGMAKGVPNMLQSMGKAVSGNPEAASEAIQSVAAGDQRRVEQGRSLPYRAVAPAGDIVGLNTAAMENAADEGDTRAVFGHAAAPVVAVAGAKGVSQAVPRVAAIPAVASQLERVRTKISAPLARTMTTPRGSIPAESATPAEIKAYAEQNNIGPLTAAQITEHNLPRHFQTAGERAGIGGTQIRQNVKSAQSSIAQHAERLMDEASPNVKTSAEVGDAIKTGIQNALERERTASTQRFAAIDKQARGVAVDLRPIKQLAGELLNDTSFIREKLKSADPKRMTSILSDVRNLPDQGTFSQAQSLRSTLFDEASHPDLAISSQAQAAIKRLTSATHEQMAIAAESKPGLMASFEEASTHWRELHDSFNNSRSPLAQALQEIDPNKVAQKFHSKGQQGGSPFNAELLDKYGIDKGPIKRAILQDIYAHDFRIHGKTLAGYSDQFLRSVFTPEELSRIYKTGSIARSVGLNVNPPNTAETLDAMGGDAGSAKRVLFKSAKARMTKSPGFNRWMTNTGIPHSNRPVQSVSGPSALPLSVLLGVESSSRNK